MLKLYGRDIWRQTTSRFKKVYISTLIWKENVTESWLKNIYKNIEIKRVLGPSAEDVVKDVNLENKTCIITGATGSIGLELSRCLSVRGCSVLMACRNQYRARLAAERTRLPRDRLSIYHVDLASLASVKLCADRVLDSQKKIDIVILNAATFGLPWTLTEDNLETTFQVNFLSQYYFLLLLGRILAPDVRVVFTSAESHRNIKWPTERSFAPTLEDLSLPEHEYTSIKSYNISKLCGVLLMHYLSDRWSRTERSVFCAHPGSFIKTGLCRNWWLYEALYILMYPFSKNVSQGASTVAYCATRPQLGARSGAYWRDCAPRAASELARSLPAAYGLHDRLADALRERAAGVDQLLRDVSTRDQ